MVSALFGILFGAPTLRLRGDYLAIVTLGFGEIVPILARNLTGLTNGAAGLNGVQPPHLFGYNFGIDAVPYYYVGLGLIALLIFTSVRLRDSRIGRAWMAIREDETAASAMGGQSGQVQAAGVRDRGGFRGDDGGLLRRQAADGDAEMFNFNVSSMLLVMVVLGGMGSVWGVVLGAVILQLMQSWFLPGLSRATQELGIALGSDWLQRVDLVQSTQLLFG